MKKDNIFKEYTGNILKFSKNVGKELKIFGEKIESIISFIELKNKASRNNIYFIYRIDKPA